MCEYKRKSSITTLTATIFALFFFHLPLSTSAETSPWPLYTQLAGKKKVKTQLTPERKYYPNRQKEKQLSFEAQAAQVMLHELFKLAASLQSEF